MHYWHHKASLPGGAKYQSLQRARPSGHTVLCTDRNGLSALITGPTWKQTERETKHPFYCVDTMQSSGCSNTTVQLASSPDTKNKSKNQITSACKNFRFFHLLGFLELCWLHRPWTSYSFLVSLFRIRSKNHFFVTQLWIQTSIYSAGIYWFFFLNCNNFALKRNFLPIMLWDTIFMSLFFSVLVVN